MYKLRLIKEEAMGASFSANHDNEEQRWFDERPTSASGKNKTQIERR